MRGINSDNMNWPPVATVTAVTFIVTFAPVLCGLAQSQEVTNTADCSTAQKGTQVFDVKAPTTLTLKCRTGVEAHVKPKFDTNDFRVCTNAKCTDPPLLSAYINGASGTMVSNISATVKIASLPSEAKNFYIQCGETPNQICYIYVKVPQAPSTPGGVTTGGPPSCETLGKAITIKIPEKGSTAQFTCGSLTLHPPAAGRVFAEDCKKEEDLKNIARSARADKVGSVYTLTAEKKPPNKKWCYLCAKPGVTPSEAGKPSEYCTVHVESSSRTHSSSAIALAAVLPCVLAMLRIT